MSSLCAGSPGLTIDQPSPMSLNAPSRVSRRSLALRFEASGPWQRKQRSDSSGRIWKRKSTRATAASDECGARSGPPALAADRHAGEAGERASRPARRKQESAFLVSSSLCASAPAVSRRPPPMREPSRHARPPSKRPRAGHPCSPAGPMRLATARTRVGGRASPHAVPLARA